MSSSKRTGKAEAEASETLATAEEQCGSWVGISRTTRAIVKLKTLVPLTLLTIMVASAAHLVLEQAQIRHASVSLWSRVSENPQVSLLNIAIIWLLVALLLAATGRAALTFATVLSAAGVLAYAQRMKLNLRHEPVFPSELTTLANFPILREFVGMPGLVAGIVGLTAVLAGALAVDILLRRRRKQRGHFDALRQFRGLRVATVAFAVLALAQAVKFNEPGNFISSLYTKAGVEWAYWDQAGNYALNGFVAGLLYNTTVPAMNAPADYSRATMNDIRNRYTALARDLNVSRDPAALHDLNIIMVLSESLTDPTQVRGVSFDEDPLPFTRRLMETSTSGTMLSSGYGGGTANVEFEALTGYSMSSFAPQMHTPFQMLIPNFTTFPSIAHYLRSQTGHKTVALHSYSSALYRRSDVYPRLGFDKSIFEADMEHRERLENDPFSADSAVYREMINEIQRSESPVFINAVTMQNHGPFEGRYARPIRVTGSHSAEELDEIGQYGRGLRYSDDALKTFIESIERSGERTLVLVYGDHHPAIWPEKVVAENGARAIHETPFFIYKNFGSRTGDRYEATLTPNLFMNVLLDEVDAPLTPYHMLLRTVAQHVPGLSAATAISPANVEVVEERLTRQAKSVLYDYRLVQYDEAVGSGFIDSALWDLPS